MDRDTKADPEVVLRAAIQDAVVIDDLVAEPNRIIVDLDEPNIDIMADFDVDAAAEHHSKVVRANRIVEGCVSTTAGYRERPNSAGA